MSKSSISITADQFGTNWKNGMTANVTKMQEGISRVQENPMEKAAAAVDKYQAGVNAAVASGRYQAGLMQVNLADWKAVTKQKIGERLSGGVTAAQPKMTKFGQYLIPTINAGLGAIKALPNLTIDDSINRAGAWIRYMHENPYKK